MMSVSYIFYTFPVTKFNELVKSGKNNYKEIIKLLFRYRIKDKEILNFLSLELSKLLKKRFLNISELQMLGWKFTSPLGEYYRKIEEYNSWLKSKDRKILLKNVNKRLYHTPDKESLKSIQEVDNKLMKEASQKNDKKLWVPIYDIEDEKGKQIMNWESSYKKDGTLDVRIFPDTETFELYQKLKEFKRKEKEWQKLRKWYINRKQWLLKHNLNSRNFKLAYKILRAISDKGLHSTIFRYRVFEDYEAEFLKLLEDLKKHE